MGFSRHVVPFALALFLVTTGCGGPEPALPGAEAAAPGGNTAREEAATAPPVPEPTATAREAPAATATQLPTATPRPRGRLEMDATVEPQAVPQGGVALVRVRSNWPIIGLEGDLAGRPVLFDWQGEQGWAFAGFNSQASTGPQTLTIALTAPEGQTARTALRLNVTPASFPVEAIYIPPPPPAPPGAPAPVDPLAPSVMSQEWNRVLSITRQATPHRHWNQPFLLPATGEIASVYGTRRSYNGGPPVEPHQGMDFEAEAGTPVVASNSGVVRTARWDVRGNVVLIDHGLGLWSGYYHLSQVLVADGQVVERGQVIGRAGATGLATGPHVHWDMVLQGVHTDPLAWTKLSPPALP